MQQMMSSMQAESLAMQKLQMSATSLDSTAIIK
jgi:hypothetical protein